MVYHRIVNIVLCIRQDHVVYTQVSDSGLEFFSLFPSMSGQNTKPGSFENVLFYLAFTWTSYKQPSK